jgi:hypothetical protein
LPGPSKDNNLQINTIQEDNMEYDQSSVCPSNHQKSAKNLNMIKRLASKTESNFSLNFANKEHQLEKAGGENSYGRRKSYFRMKTMTFLQPGLQGQAMMDESIRGSPNL